MIEIKNLVFVVLCFFGDACCMVPIHQYDRSAGMPAWEGNRLNALAVQYDGAGSVVGIDLAIGVTGHFAPPLDAQFVQQFVACSRGGRVEDPTGVGGNPMDPILLAHAQNVIGREIMYRIIAKLEPRIQCVDSVRAVIYDMNSEISSNLLDSINICANLLVGINIARNDSAADFISDLIGFANGHIDPSVVFNALFNNPVVFVSNRIFQCANGDSITITDSAVATAVINNVIRILNVHESNLRANVDALRFRLVFDPTAQDQYAPADNTIIITGNPCNCNLVTGPILSNGFEQTHVETQWRQLQASSTLKHELGHYLRIGLENMVGDPAFLNVGPALFVSGVLSSEYVIHLADIWDDAEELAEIFGIVFSGGNLLRDRLNQSDFNLEGEPHHADSVRYSHRDSRFPLVPYKFFNSAFERGGVLPIPDKNVVFYDKPIASI